MQESSGCTKNEMADKKLWLFNSAPIELTKEFLVKTEQKIGEKILL